MYEIYFAMPGYFEPVRIEVKHLEQAQFLWDSLDASNFKMVSARP